MGPSQYHCPCLRLYWCQSWLQSGSQKCACGPTGSLHQWQRPMNGIEGSLLESAAFKKTCSSPCASSAKSAINFPCFKNVWINNVQRDPRGFVKTLGSFSGDFPLVNPKRNSLLRYIASGCYCTLSNRTV